MKIKCRVVGKSIHRGFIYNDYFIELHDLENNVFVKRQVPFGHYIDLDIGETILVKRFW